MQSETCFSLYFHSSFNGQDAKYLCQRANQELLELLGRISQASHLFLTFGTAWVYQTRNKGQIAANCHRLPASNFERRLLSISEISACFGQWLPLLWEINRDLQLVFTISPVRHWRDGAVANQRSKAILHLAVHEILKQDRRCHYFPAYEIVLDELRDYRFFAEDMLHPSGLAIDYVWQKFQDAFIGPTEKPILQRMEGIVRAANHRPRFAKSGEHQEFLHRQLNKIGDLRREFPYLPLDELERNFRTQINV